MKTNKHPFTVKQIADNSGFLLWQVTSIWQQKQKRALEKNHNISHSQYVVLASIYWLTLTQKEVTQVCLSQHTKIEPMTISQLLKVLQKAGYTNRKPHSVDSRAKSVYLTPEGKELMRKAIVTIETIDALFFETLGKGIKKFNVDMEKLIESNTNKS